MKTKDTLIWQDREEMPQPTNPLQKLVEVLAFTSRDCSEDKMISFMYGIIAGWDDNSYEELKIKHGWTDDDINYQKLLHKNYNIAWKLLMENNKNK